MEEYEACEGKDYLVRSFLPHFSVSRRIDDSLSQYDKLQSYGAPPTIASAAEGTRERVREGDE